MDDDDDVQTLEIFLQHACRHSMTMDMEVRMDTLDNSMNKIARLVVDDEENEDDDNVMVLE